MDYESWSTGEEARRCINLNAGMAAIDLDMILTMPETRGATRYPSRVQAVVYIEMYTVMWLSIKTEP